MIYHGSVPFKYAGNKRQVAREIWRRFGHVDRYIEPFCGSAAVLLAAEKPCKVEIINDLDGFVANFWRAIISNPSAVASWADCPISQIDMGARRRWLHERRESIAAGLADADWPGDHKAAGWWLHGQCASFAQYVDWSRRSPSLDGIGPIPGSVARGTGIFAASRVHDGDGERYSYLTSHGAVAHRWLTALSQRLQTATVLHGDWQMSLKIYDAFKTDVHAVFLDPPYQGYEQFYSRGTADCQPPAAQAAAWAAGNGDRIKIAICGHDGDYDLPGWDQYHWTRKSGSFRGSTKTRGLETIWFSPACNSP